MKKISLAIIISLFSIPSMACECHGTGQFSGAFGSFAGWQLPNSGCIPTHSLGSVVAGEDSTNEKRSDGKDVAEEKQSMESEGSISDVSIEPSLETSS